MPGSNNFCDTTACIDYISATVLNSSTWSSYTVPLTAIYPYEVDALPKFPSVSVIDNGLRRKYAGTHMFDLTLGVQLIVMHGFLTSPLATRSQIDLQIARQVTLALHADRTLGGNIVQGWVAKEDVISLKTQSDIIKCSSLQWVGEAREIDVT